MLAYHFETQSVLDVSHSGIGTILARHDSCRYLILIQNPYSGYLILRRNPYVVSFWYVELLIFDYKFDSVKCMILLDYFQCYEIVYKFDTNTGLKPTTMR